VGTLRPGGLALALGGLVWATVVRLAATPVPVMALWEGRPQRGRPSVAIVLQDGATVALAYRHSVWGVVVAEWLEATREGWRLVGVEGPTPDIEAYYHIPGARMTRVGERYRLDVDTPVEMPLITVQATEVGDRTLVVGARCLPLSRIGRTVTIGRLRVPLGQWVRTVDRADRMPWGRCPPDMRWVARSA